MKKHDFLTVVFHKKHLVGKKMLKCIFWESILGVLSLVHPFGCTADFYYFGGSSTFICNTLATILPSDVLGQWSVNFHNGCRFHRHLQYSYVCLILPISFWHITRLSRHSNRLIDEWQTLRHLSQFFSDYGRQRVTFKLL